MLAQRAEQCILCKIIRLGCVPGDAKTERIDGFGVWSDQRAECGSIPIVKPHLEHLQCVKWDWN